LYALYLASKDLRTPFLAKFTIVLLIAYALSPVDLIPDFLPVIGFLDDLILLPIGIYFSIRLIPKKVWLKYQASAKKKLSELPRNNQTIIIVVLIIMILWLLVISGLLLWLLPYITKL